MTEGTETGLRFVLGVVGGVLGSAVVGLCAGGAAGWIAFVVGAPVLGLVTAKWGYGLWKILGGLLSLP